MRKWIFSFYIFCAGILGYQILQDYQEYKGFLSRIDKIIMQSNEITYHQDLSEQNNVLSDIIDRNEKRFFPNFWEEWYLGRKFTLLPMLQQSDKYKEMLLLASKLYRKTGNPFYLQTRCLLLERIGMIDRNCYQEALIELKKQEEYFNLLEYWLMATAVGDPDMEKNTIRLFSDEKELIDQIVKDREKVLKEMFP